MPITLPERPLKLSPKARPGYIVAYLSGILLLALGVFLMAWETEGLQRQLEDQPQPGRRG